MAWSDERLFWRRQILPLVEINYWRSLDASGQPTDLSWRIDLPFQLLFLLDIGLRSLRLRRRYPAISWRDAVLRRWIDLPLLLPIGRVLRVVPVTERLSRTNLIQLEPLRAVISRGVVALLAIELFEVITIRVVDALQQLIRSPQLPERIRSLCSHQSAGLKPQSELLELLRLWVPVLMVQVGPSLRPNSWRCYITSSATTWLMDWPLHPSADNWRQALWILCSTYPAEQENAWEPRMTY